MNNGSLLKNIVVLALIGFVAVVTIGVGLAVAKAVAGMAIFALFTLGPIMLVGWLVLKVLRYFTRNGSEAIV